MKELKDRDKANTDLSNRVIDINKATIDCMRAVLATARVINAQTPDVGMSLALKNYDKCKLKSEAK